MKKLVWLMAAAFPLASESAMPARAAVAEADAAGFRIARDIAIAVPVPRAWEALLEVSGWWSARHTYSGDASRLKLDARAGGCWCETLADGGVQHMTVVRIERPGMLVLHGALGPLQGMGVTGAMTFELKPESAGTRLTMTYVVSGRLGKEAAGIAAAVDGVLGEQIDRLGPWAVSGKRAP